MKIKLTYHNQKPFIEDMDFNELSEPHLKELDTINKNEYIFRRRSELERFIKREKWCEAVTYKNGALNYVKVERIS